MKRKATILSYVLVLVFIPVVLLAQTIQGTVKDPQNSPIPQASVKIKNKEIFTDSMGRFSINAKTGDTLIVSTIGYSKLRMIIVEGVSEFNIILEESNFGLQEVNVTASSSQSSWVGATLFYNFDGGGLDNTVGAAKVRLNSIKTHNPRFKFNIIGNITNFSTDVNQEDLSKGLRTLAQTAQGLSIGVEPLFILKHERNWDLRGWVTANYKLNSFTNIPNVKDGNVNLSQGKFTCGIEFDGLEFNEGKKRLFFGIEGGISLFDKELYNQVFNEKKNKFASLEWTLILPLNGNLGFTISQTIANGIKPAIAAGIVISQ